MFMRMLYDEGLAQATYLIGCPAAGEAIVIDPLRDVDRYIDTAAAEDLRITKVTETHIHADFLSGVRELAERVGAEVLLSGEGGEAWQYEWLHDRIGGGSYDHRVLKDGDRIEIGAVELRTLHTPGHTPEHLSFVVRDRGAGADEPMGILTGDFVFVGDLGRPDLLETAAGHQGAMRPAARRLHASAARLAELPDFAQVWPGHGAGSACGKALGGAPTSTIGYERRFNPALALVGDEDRFVDEILEGQPEPPLYFARMKRLNKQGPPVLGAMAAPTRLAGETLASLDAARATLVDVRPWEAFRDGHAAGSLSFPLIRSFCTDAGSMLDPEQELYLIADAAEAGLAVRKLGVVGLDRVRGWFDPSDIAGHLTETINEVDVATARSMLERGEVRPLDVRRAAELADGTIADATHVVHTQLAARLDEVDRDGTWLVYCRTGKRSARAAALLQRAKRDVVNLEGGFAEWSRQVPTPSS